MKVHIKKRVFEIISKADEGDTASKIFDGFIMALISLSVLSIILESFQDIASKYSSLFSAFETFSVTAFSIEYALRIWTANYLYPDSKHPKLKYITSIMAVIDLVSILPFFLPFISADMRFLRMFRLLRIARVLRVFKLGRTHHCKSYFKFCFTTDYVHCDLFLRYAVLINNHVYGRKPCSTRTVSGYHFLPLVGHLHINNGRLWRRIPDYSSREILCSHYKPCRHRNYRHSDGHYFRRIHVFDRKR